MNWIQRRVTQFAATLISVITITFMLIRYLPGGPMDYLRGQLATGSSSSGVNTAELNQLMEVYTGVNPQKPILEQYVNYVFSLLRGDLGVSIWYQEPVFSIIKQSLPWTVFVMTISLMVVYFIGILVGALMAYRETSRIDSYLTFIFSVLNSIPYYVMAIVLLTFFAYQIPLFPVGGRMGSSVEVGFNIPFITSIFYHATLPVLSLVIALVGGIALQMRGNSIHILGEDYLRVARLRALPRNYIATHYVARNAILPMYTQLILSLGVLFGGSIILETIFRYHGIGYFLFQAINTRDYPLMMGCFLVITLAVVTGVLIADLTYGKLDPRIKGEDNEVY